MNKCAHLGPIEHKNTLNGYKYQTRIYNMLLDTPAVHLNGPIYIINVFSCMKIDHFKRPIKVGAASGKLFMPFKL